jgi:hypothetical protein
MKMVVRILVGLSGLVSLLMMLNLWFHMGSVTGTMGLVTEGIVGRASVRADVAGMFGGIGFFSLMAAWKQSRTWAFGALIMVSLAIAGRFVGVALDGSGPGVWGPIGVEAFMIALLVWARQLWRPSL